MIVVHLDVLRKVIFYGFFFLSLRNSERAVEVLERLVIYFAALCPKCIDAEMDQGKEFIILDSFSWELVYFHAAERSCQLFGLELVE